MKTFLNVLYRRILYKIPLKLLLILLAVFGLLFACTKAEDFNSNYYSSIQHGLFSNNFFSVERGKRTIRFYNGNISNKYICVGGNLNSNSTNISSYKLYTCPSEKSADALLSSDGNCSFLGTFTHTRVAEQLTNVVNDYCYNTEDVKYMYITSDGTQDNLSYVYFSFYFSDRAVLEYSSQECQTEYNLIPINEVDSSYCQSNNLCPSGGSPSDCPNVGISNVFINDLFHPGAFNIVMNIPQEIDWDYAYTNSGNNLNIDVVGYNVDYEKMQDIIDIQNYKPNSDELSTIISSIVPLFVPGLCIILLLYFIFRFIKKIF